MKISESFSTRTTTICGLIDASSLSPVTKALFPSVDPVYTKRISPLAIFISGDSSYFSRVIYVFLHSMVNLLFTILVGLKVKTPPASFVTISLSVYPLNPILPLSLQVSPNLRCSQTDPVYLSIMKTAFVFLIYYILIIVYKNQMIFIYNFEAYDVYHRKPQIILFLKLFFLLNDCL